MEAINEQDADIVGDIEAAGAKFARAKEAVGACIYGQDPVIEQSLITILCGGHALLVGVPGLAKTIDLFQKRRRALTVTRPRAAC